ncbi:MFS transporter [Paenibacillus agricola]|uniref:MFS transporter n=1 Tax=Paenibacillus agricola TaxID=2716264 RepID=A0ABX0J6Y2_9BACL|nr:MFS transporter [Paenibacillus agricola]NHN29550.1 MFS transporter [Paenibacillus agricola]
MQAKDPISSNPAKGASQPAALPSSRLIQALCFVLFFSVMNATMFNVALPNIAADYQLKPSSVSWIVTGYSVLYALGSLLFGKLADKYPMKRLITIGLLLFAAGSVLGFFSTSYPVVLMARFIQAAGASCVPALVMLIPIRFYPPEKRGAVMGVIASTIAFSSGIGPIVGGFIAGHFHWTGLFLLSVAAPIALPFIRKSLPHEVLRQGEKIDLIGAGALGISVTAFMLSVTQSNVWWLLTGIIMLVLFVVRVNSVSNPFIRLSLFRISGFTNGLIVAFVGMFTVFGIFLTVPMLLSSIHHMNAQSIGFVMFPAAIIAVFMGRLGGKLVDRRGTRFTLYVAFSMLTIGLLCLSAVSGLLPWVIGLSLIFLNSALTFMQSSLAKEVSSALPKEQTGIGMGIYNLIIFMSGAISGAVMSKVVEFNWGSVNFTAVSVPTTFGTVYFSLAVLAVLNIGWVYLKIGRQEAALLRSAVKI